MKHTHIWLLLLVMAGFASCKKEPKVVDLGSPQYPVQNDSVDLLKINHVQVIGSHNSYRTKTDIDIFTLVNQLYSDGIIPQDLDPKGWDYSHGPLPEQFGAFGMRGIELDIYEDVNGGRFYSRGGMLLVDKDPLSGIPDLNEPGFKILHIPDFDFNTNYYTFKKALLAIKSWSDNNPTHIPIFINVETKTDVPSQQLPLSFLLDYEPLTAGASDALDAEVKSVFGNDLDRVITPDDVRGSYTTLREAVLAGNWPTLGDARGKIMFIMEGDMVGQYVQGHPSLQGRAMFTYAEPSDDEAAFVIINDPIGGFNDIQQTVAQGFIVRTRADAETDQARTGDYSMMNSAISSGAQIISTDYYTPDLRYLTDPQNWTNYHVSFPGGITYRINPVTAANQVHFGAIVE